MREYLKKCPQDHQSWAKLAHVLAWTGNAAESQQIFQRLATERPDDHQIRLRWAEAEMANRATHQQALKRFEDYLKSMR